MHKERTYDGDSFPFLTLAAKMGKTGQKFGRLPRTQSYIFACLQI